MSLKTVSKQYILLASIYSKTYSHTPFDISYMTHPAYIHIKYDDSGFDLIYEQEHHRFAYDDILSLKVSICGRRATLHQTYLITFHMILNSDIDMEIETYDYDDALSFYQKVRNKNILAEDPQCLVKLYQKLQKNPKALYQYVDAHLDEIFASHPEDRKRLDFARSTIHKKR